jgi:hypothetical protein
MKPDFTPAQMQEMADSLEGLRGSLKAEHVLALAADMLRRAAQSFPPAAGEIEVTSSWNPQDGPYKPSTLKMPDGIPSPMAFRDAFAAMATAAGDNDALKRLDQAQGKNEPPCLAVGEVVALGTRHVRVIGLCRHRFNRVAVRNTETNRLSYIRPSVLLLAKGRVR